MNKQELLEELNKIEDENEEEEEIYRPYISPYERARAAVYATGNKWAIENFNATH